MKNLVNIGVVRYADHYHPTNRLSAERLKELAKSSPELAEILKEISDINIPRSLRKICSKIAAQYGYKIHFFEKGLGR